MADFRETKPTVAGIRYYLSLAQKRLLELDQTALSITEEENEVIVVLLDRVKQTGRATRSWDQDDERTEPKKVVEAYQVAKKLADDALALAGHPTLPIENQDGNDTAPKPNPYVRLTQGRQASGCALALFALAIAVAVIPAGGILWILALAAVIGSFLLPALGLPAIPTLDPMLVAFIFGAIPFLVSAPLVFSYALMRMAERLLLPLWKLKEQLGPRELLGIAEHGSGISAAIAAKLAGLELSAKGEDR